MIRPEAARECARRILPESLLTETAIDMVATIIMLSVATDEQDAKNDELRRELAALERAKEQA